MGLNELLGGVFVNFGLPALAGLSDSTASGCPEPSCKAPVGCGSLVCREVGPCPSTACAHLACSVGGCVSYVNGTGRMEGACGDGACMVLSGATPDQ